METPRIIARVATALFFALAAAAAGAQQVEQDTPVLSKQVAERLDGFNYEEGPESELGFRGTPLALAAKGEGEVEFQDGRARVQVEVEKLPSPGHLGPFATYVLWAVTADGNANNIGAIEVRDGRGELKAATPLSKFGLMVTAEPHFAVTAPSQAVVLQNFSKRVRGQPFNIAGLKQRIDYSQLAPQARDEKHEVPPDLVQARYAVAIAEAADAERFASAEYQKAQGLLAQAEAAETGKGGSRRDVPEIARNAVQSAEDARRRAVEGATAARAKEEAAAKAAEAAAQAAAAEAAAGERKAQEAAQAGAQVALQAAREDLVERLNRVLPTTETDRGIVAEISGVQFATGKATLNPDARESLAKFAGIVGVYPGMKFRVEGHTDSTGGYEFNRELSLKRASSVRDYLVAQGVPNSSIDVEGLGPDRPVTSNETKEGRARNRRVEIILEGDPVAGP